MKVLGIESSCDETGVAVYDTARPGAEALRAHAVGGLPGLHGQRNHKVVRFQIVQRARAGGDEHRAFLDRLALHVVRGEEHGQRLLGGKVFHQRVDDRIAPVLTVAVGRVLGQALDQRQPALAHGVVARIQVERTHALLQRPAFLENGEFLLDLGHLGDAAVQALPAKVGLCRRKPLVELVQQAGNLDVGIRHEIAHDIAPLFAVVFERCKLLHAPQTGGKHKRGSVPAPANC